MRAATVVATVTTVAACAASTSQIIVAEDPVTGAPTAYGTVFLDDASRLVLSAPTAGGDVRATLWTAVDEADCAAVVVTVAGADVRPEVAEARVVETPSGADQTVVFGLSRAVLEDLGSTDDAVLRACASRWVFDREDRRVILELLAHQE